MYFNRFEVYLIRFLGTFEQCGQGLTLRNERKFLDAVKIVQ